MMAIVFVAAVAAVVSSVVVIKQSNRIATIERKLSSGSIDQVAAFADRDSHNQHFSLPSMDNKTRIDGVLLANGVGFLTGGNVKDAPAGTDFQLWAQTTTGPVSLGWFADDVDDSFAFHLPEGADRLFVTTEVLTGATSPNPAAVVVSGPLTSQE
jgi:hypothetical protein